MTFLSVNLAQNRSYSGNRKVDHKIKIRINGAGKTLFNLTP